MKLIKTKLFKINLDKVNRFSLNFLKQIHRRSVDFYSYTKL